MGKKELPSGFYLISGNFFEVPEGSTLQYEESIHGQPQSFPSVDAARAAYRAANPRAKKQELDDIFGQE